MMNHQKRCTVVNKKNESFDVYIGRPSKWGNPFKIEMDVTRERAIELYRDYINHNPYLMASLYELKGKRLGCFCKPLPCHGDILVELVESLPK